MAVFVQSGCNCARVVVIGQSGCIRVKWLFSVKTSCVLASDCIWTRVFVLGQRCSIRAKVVL